MEQNQTQKRSDRPFDGILRIGNKHEKVYLDYIMKNSNTIEKFIIRAIGPNMEKGKKIANTIEETKKYHIDKTEEKEFPMPGTGQTKGLEIYMVRI